MTTDSAETLTFSTHRIPFCYEGSPAGSVPLSAEMVVAIDAPVINTYLEQTRYPRLRGGAEYEARWRLGLSLEAASRLLELYNLTLVTQKARKYECHTLPSYVLGARQDIGLGHGDTYTLGERVVPYGLEAGAPYMMLNDRKTGKHAVIGMGPDYPRHVLSILGGQGIFAVTRIMPTMDTFQATHIAPIQYDALVPARV